MDTVRVAVAGAGAFGRHHLRVLGETAGVSVVAVADPDIARAQDAAASLGCDAVPDVAELRGRIVAAIVAVPTSAHAEVGCALLESGVDVLIEKPIAPDLESAQRLIDAAEKHSRILQVGHLERFNPAIEALAKVVSNPLFFEIHRLSVYTPRSLDVDVVLDLMIHDIDILLSLTGSMPVEVRAVGLPVLSDKVDISNVRLAFANGCVANLTASRVSTERVRKLRLFQPHQYISLDYQKQEAVCFNVSADRKIGFLPLFAPKQEPLKREVESFLNAVRTRTAPRVGGPEAARALEVSLNILDKIKEHQGVIAGSLGLQATSGPGSSS